MAWTYEQLFNGLSTADLNGQDSWSGDALFDVGTAGTPNEGAKCVSSVLNSDSGITIDRAVTGIAAGTVYVSFKVNRTSGMRRGSVILMSGSTEVARLFLLYDVTTWHHVRVLTSAGWTDIKTDVANDTWVRVGFDFDAVAQPNKYRVNVDGGAWTAWALYWTSPSWATIDKIRLQDDGNNGSGAGTMYFDTISPDYTPGGGGGARGGGGLSMLGLGS